MGNETAIIIGAGPAGLTAAFELQKKTTIKPVILEMTDKIGGISRTEDFNGNKMDIGGHRFFSKHDTIVNWWLDLLPLQGAPALDDILLNRNVSLSPLPGAPDPQKTDQVMLVRPRHSRILFGHHFFDYPLSLNWKALSDFGLSSSLLILQSYIRSQLLPVRPEKSLEDFFVNRFGKRLYIHFFKDYTEKLWGVSCRDILPDWGFQRVKGLSISKALSHAFEKRIFKKSRSKTKHQESSLIDTFFYPKFGPGQLWETVAQKIKDNSGEILFNHKVVGMTFSGSSISEVEVENRLSGEKVRIKGDYFISTMPVKYLIQGMGTHPPQDVRNIAANLYYRDLIVVGLLLNGLKLKNTTGKKTLNNIVPDSWIYIQNKNARVGRVQLFNNWNPYMVADLDLVWMGLEVCCSKNDEIWRLPDEKIALSVSAEMASLGILGKQDVLDWVVVRQPKAYPGYTGVYKRFETIKRFTDALDNLFLIGRNGMHRYNNMDHSMLTAMQAVENIVMNTSVKSNIWNINVEHDYHEIK